ncbi:ATP phosphoribosyltransferase [Acrasis kona]|uniref:ATP phosphoribosyltransferase n=1 Tax=Acrasis kona TaxID=1008807 RepID=A0AAW2YX13_9EUKA
MTPPATLTLRVERELNSEHELDNETRVLNIRREINALPKLSEKQFRALPEEQKKQYTQTLERLASQCAVYMSRTNQTTPMSKTASSHLTIMALQIAQQKRDVQRKKELNQIRQDIIEKNKSCFISPVRLLHRLKKSRLTQDRVLEEVNLDSENILLTNHFGPELIRTKAADLAVVRQDLTKKWGLTNSLAINECLLYVLSPDKFDSLELYTPDQLYEQKRTELNEQTIIINERNEALRSKWDHMTLLERLSKYVKPELINSFDEIVDKAKHLGLDEPKILELLLDSNTTLYKSGFDGNYNVVPMETIDATLMNGVHTISNILSKKLNIPESALRMYLSEQQIWELNGMNEKLAKKTIGKFLRLDVVSEFKKYWDHIVLLDEPEVNQKVNRKENTVPSKL